MDIKQELLKLLERRVFNAEELVEEIDKLYKQDQALQLQQTGVSGSVCLYTELQIKLGELMQQFETSHCYLEKKKLRNKMNVICILLDIDTF